MYRIDFLGILCEITLSEMPQSTFHGESTLIQAGDTKPLPDPVLAQIYVAIWRH